MSKFVLRLLGAHSFLHILTAHAQDFKV